MRRAAILLATVLVLAACGDVASEDAASTTVAPVAETASTSAEAEAPGTSTSPGSTTTAIVTTQVPPATSPAEQTTTTTQGDAVTGKVPADLLASIIADAAQRIGAAESDFTVVRARPATWNDGSLGCPEPGMSYTQALVNGYWVVIEYGGVELDYRASSIGDFRLCIGGGSPPLDANL